jgi:acetyltransferase-like isoleucine patch superfamily enzyme
MTRTTKLIGFIGSVLDPRAYLHFFRLIHYVNYSHVRERRLMTVGSQTGIAPNVSFRNGERITIGQNSHIGERCYLWAGNETGRIVIGNYVSLAPEVFITASNYQFAAGKPFREQPKSELDVRIGDDVWLGAGVVVVAGVEIGSGCIVGAGAVVTKSLPPNSIAGGVPAKVLSSRPE